MFILGELRRLLIQYKSFEEECEKYSDVCYEVIFTFTSMLDYMLIDISRLKESYQLEIIDDIMNGLRDYIKSIGGHA